MKPSMFLLLAYIGLDGIGFFISSLVSSSFVLGRREMFITNSCISASNPFFPLSSSFFSSVISSVLLVFLISGVPKPRITSLRTSGIFESLSPLNATTLGFAFRLYNFFLEASIWLTVTSVFPMKKKQFIIFLPNSSDCCRLSSA